MEMQCDGEDDFRKKMGNTEDYHKGTVGYRPKKKWYLVIRR